MESDGTGGRRWGNHPAPNPNPNPNPNSRPQYEPLSSLYGSFERR
jgi:hypothetical protein